MGAKLLDPVARFWERVDVKGPSECWPWLGCRNNAGYGQVNFRRKSQGAHRVAYELTNGPVAAHLQLDHFACDNKLCCNPSHLKQATPRENTLRNAGTSAENARKTHCIRGHPFSGSNLRVSAEGFRSCRACGRLRTKACSAGIPVGVYAGA